MFENFEWLARYSAWWKETPRPARAPNYSATQFDPALDGEFEKLRPSGSPDLPKSGDSTRAR